MRFPSIELCNKTTYLLFMFPCVLFVFVLMSTLMLAGCPSDGKERISVISLSAAALNDYQGFYRRDQSNKAFAISPDGAFAAAYSFPSIDLATAAALINCNARVQPGQLECLVYDINGKTIVEPPVRLSRFGP